MAKRKNSKENASEHISFRLTPELMKILATYASSLEGDTGVTLTPGQAARRLVVSALRQNQNKDNFTSNS